MAIAYDVAIISALQLRVNNSGKTKKILVDKGKALEELIKYLFDKMPDISVTESNVISNDTQQEVDLACYNDGRTDLRGFPNVFLVECKNLNDKVNAQQLAAFVDKLRTSHVQVGMIITRNGITGKARPPSAAYAKVLGAMTQGIRVLVIGLAEMCSITNTDEMATMLKRKYLKTTLLAN